MTGGVTAFSHKPVLLDEMICALQPRDGGKYIDGTFGAGGYSRAILESANCNVWAIDQDPDAISNDVATSLVKKYSGRLVVIQGRFGNMEKLLSGRGLHKADGITLDLGISSIQLDNGNRGFSFRQDGPLDMRLSKTGRTAEDIVNDTGESELADIIFKNGEEPQARRIARAISVAKELKKITGTAQLADIVRSTVRVRKAGKIDPATKTFQALRIEVNDELTELKRGLKAAEILLSPGGRLAIVSFHSLEDRIVKSFLRSRSGVHVGRSRHLPAQPAAYNSTTFRLIKRGVVKPKLSEIQDNPRARSARMRIAERLANKLRGS
ncbi:MAG: 16S rRNA (cytosine(1402)-N(4))-methyltransferase RsmH [Pseudomonadota bacterium]|nr:16S rRNA (cytosine(1402)-N(4))-methyltransferase RsmH [Pseudomonadota bacterium]